MKALGGEMIIRWEKTEKVVINYEEVKLSDWLATTLDQKILYSFILGTAALSTLTPTTPASIPSVFVLCASPPALFSTLPSYTLSSAQIFL